MDTSDRVNQNGQLLEKIIKSELSIRLKGVNNGIDVEERVIAPVEPSPEASTQVEGFAKESCEVDSKEWFVRTEPASPVRDMTDVDQNAVTVDLQFECDPNLKMFIKTEPPSPVSDSTDIDENTARMQLEFEPSIIKMEVTSPAQGHVDKHSTSPTGLPKETFEVDSKESCQVDNKEWFVKSEPTSPVWDTAEVDQHPEALQLKCEQSSIKAEVTSAHHVEEHEEESPPGAANNEVKGSEWISYCPRTDQQIHVQSEHKKLSATQCPHCAYNTSLKNHLKTHIDSMPGSRCCVTSCSNSLIKTKEHSGPQIIAYHTFPKDVQLRKTWILKCKKGSDFNPNSGRVCSEHFTQDSFEDDIEARVMGLIRPRKLKQGAFPTEKLRNTPQKENETTPQKKKEAADARHARLEKRRSKQIVSLLLKDTKSDDDFEMTEDFSPPQKKKEAADARQAKLEKRRSKQNLSLLSKDTKADDDFEMTEDFSPPDSPPPEISPPDSPPPHSPPPHSPPPHSPPPDSPPKFVCDLCKNLSVSVIINEKDILEEQVKALKEEVKKLKKELETFTKQEIVVVRSSSKEETELKNLKDALKKVLSDAQINLLTKKKGRATWSSEDIRRAFTLRYISKRAYLFTKNHLNVPLPGVSTLQSWASNICVNRGIFQEIISLLQVTAATQPTAERLCVVAFDEIKLKECYEYDVPRDAVIGPHKYMQVAIVRGLIKNFKQVIYAEFDQPMTKEILLDILSALRNANFIVVAVVSDLGASNLGLWNNLNVNMTTPWFKTTTDDLIFVFPDAPHLLKLTRNWILDKGFVLEDGTLVSIEPLQALLEEDCKELRAVFKISKKHLSVKDTHRQKVRLAAETLSHTVATALRRYKPGKDPQVADSTADFIDLCNQWFDIMNSSKTPYGQQVKKQEEILDAFEAMVTSMRCNIANPNESLEVFQEGIIMSIKALKELFSFLNKKYNVKYIQTHRLNQDVLVNTFVQLRSSGGLPSPLSALARLRMLCLENWSSTSADQSKVNRSSANTMDPDTDEQLLVEVFKKAKVPVEAMTSEEAVECDSSSLSSESSPRSQEQSTEFSEDDLLHLAGCIAYKFKDRYPDLGEQTSSLPPKDHSYSEPSCVSQLSNEGLIEPSVDFIEKIKIMNHTFHKEFDKRKDTIKTHGIVNLIFQKIVKSISDLDEAIIKTFVKQRLLIKINYLNNVSTQ